VRALYGARQRQFRFSARSAEPSKLARDAGGVEFGHRVVEVLKRLLDAFRARLIADIQPHGAIFHLDRIDAQPVASVQRGAGLQVEFPVVPVASQHAIAVERALDQRIAFVRTAVVAGEDLTLVQKQRKLLAPEFHRDAPRPLQLIEFDRASPLGDARVTESSGMVPDLISRIPARSR